MQRMPFTFPFRLGLLGFFGLFGALSTAARGQALENADIGPFLVNTIQGPDTNMAYKGVVVKLGKDGAAAVCFDAELMRYMGGWVKASADADKPRAETPAQP